MFFNAYSILRLQDTPHEMSKPGAKSAPALEPMILEYNKSARIRPSNITAVATNWHDCLQAKYGTSGRFIQSGAYHTFQMPREPAELGTLARDSIAYEVSKKTYLDECTAVTKSKTKDAEKRVQIYGDMWSWCSESVRAELAMDPTFTALDAEGNDPLGLWKLLVAKVSTSAGNSPAMIRAAAQDSYGAYRQPGSVTLAEFKREYDARLRNVRDLGGYVPSEEEQAVNFINRLDRARYGGLQANIMSEVQKPPPTVAEAYRMASIWMVSPAASAGLKRESALAAEPKSSEEPAKASPQHKPQKKADDTTVCHHCGATGHYRSNCPHAKKAAAAKAKWMAERASSKPAAEAHVSEDTAKVEELDSWVCIDHGCGNDFAGIARRQQRISSLGRYELAMDSGCTTVSWGERSLLTDIQPCPPINLNGVGGTIVVSETGQHEVFGDVYYHPGLPNLVGYGPVKQRARECAANGDDSFRVYVDNEEDTFVVATPAKQYCFRNNGRGLYTCNLANEVEAVETAALGHVAYRVETVEENEKLYTKKQVVLARSVMRYSKAMGGMSLSNLMIQARSGRVQGLGFNADDVVRAFEIYGPSLEAVRGKTTKLKKKKSPQSVSHKIVDERVTMHIDLMFLSGVAFLLSYVKPLGLLICNWIKSKSVEHVRVAIDRQRSTLTSEGFKVVEITSDTESAVVAIQPELEAAGCRVSIHPPGTHSAEVDVKIRQVKNVTRSITVLPYLLPLSLLMYAVYYAVARVNMWPSSALQHNYSPMEVFTGRSVSVERDLGGRRGQGPLPFGSRCEVYEKTTNTLADRTRPALWLGSKSNSYGSGYFFLLDTEKVVARDQWKALPMDAGTINLINKIAMRGPLLPKNLRMIFKGVEIEGDAEGDAEGGADEEQPMRPISGRAAGADSSMPDPGELHVTSHPDDYYTPMNPDDLSNLAPDPLGQLEPEDSAPTDSTGARESEGTGGAFEPATETRGDAGEIGGAIGGGSVATSDQEHEPLEHRPKRSSIVPDAPWHLAGKPVDGGAPVERSSRARRPPDRYTTDSFWSVGKSAPEHNGAVEYGYNLSVSEAVDKLGDKARGAMRDELVSLEEKKVFKPVFAGSLSEEQRKRVIPCKMFLKEKYLADGTFDKIKARLVGGGHRQDKTVYEVEETSSPTASLTAVYAAMAICAAEKRSCATMDVGTAYLNADMLKVVHMRVEPAIASIMCEINPTYKRYVDKQGRVIVQLLKALYGCLESAKLWYKNLEYTLRGLGFLPNPKDSCVFNAQRNGHQLTAVLYVDDVAATSVDPEDLKWLHGELVKKYKHVSYNTGLVHNYLGMTFDFGTSGECKITMERYIEEILKRRKTTGTRVTPATETLFDVTEDLELVPKERAEEFHSTVAQLLFLALRARPDVLTATSFLTTRVTKPTREDEEKLERVLMYLNGTPQMGIVLKATEGIRIMAYVDASFATHPDMKSHSGGIITLGSGPIYVVSKKQDLVTKSSTEAELVALSNMLSQIIWLRDFLMAQGYDLGPAKIFEDNMSTIALAGRGSSNSSRTRHIAIRYFFVKDRMDGGEVVIEHLGTEDMLADALTKPLQGDLFRRMRAGMMGVE